MSVDAPSGQPIHEELVVVPAVVVGAAAAALRFMLMVHGVVATLIGVLIATDTLDGREFTILSLLPGWPSSWGAVLAAAGIATTVGRALGRLRVTRVGAGAQAFWYMAQAIGLASAAIPSGAVRYPAALYVGLGLLMYAHLRWLTDHGDWRP